MKGENHRKCSGLWKVYIVLHQNCLPLQLHATSTICADPAHSPPGSLSTPTHLHDSILASTISTREQKHLPGMKPRLPLPPKMDVGLSSQRQDGLDLRPEVTSGDL